MHNLPAFLRQAMVDPLNPRPLHCPSSASHPFMTRLDCMVSFYFLWLPWINALNLFSPSPTTALSLSLCLSGYPQLCYVLSHSHTLNSWPLRNKSTVLPRNVITVPWFIHTSNLLQGYFIFSFLSTNRHFLHPPPHSQLMSLNSISTRKQK